MALAGVSIHSSNNHYPDPLRAAPPPPCENTNEVLIRFKIENQPFLCLSEGQFLDFNFHLIYSIDRLSLHLTIIHLFNHYLLSTVRQILGSTLCIQGAIAPSRSLLSIPFSSGSRRQGHQPEVRSGTQGATSVRMDSGLQYVQLGAIPLFPNRNWKSMTSRESVSEVRYKSH